MEFHPVSELFPVMPPVEFEALVADIAQNGLREPIHVLSGAIVDGRHRYRACEQAGVEPRFVAVDPDADVYALVVSLNLRRRHLSESQRAMVAARLANLHPGMNQHTQIFGTTHEVPQICGTSQKVAGDWLNVGLRSVQHARAVIDNGTPELAAAVDSGVIAVSTADALARISAVAQREVLTRTPEEIRAFAKEVSQRIRKAGVVGPSAVRIFDELAQEKALSGSEQYALVEQLKADGPVLPTPAQAQRIAIAGEPGLMVLGSDNRYYTAPGDPEQNALYERWVQLRVGLESLGTVPFSADDAFAAIPSYQHHNVTTWLSHAVSFLNQLNTLWSKNHA